MLLTQLPDAQSKLLQHVWPAAHLAEHEPPQSPSPQCGTQQPTSLQIVAGGQLSKPHVKPLSQPEQAGSAASMRPLQSSSRPLPHTSVGLVGTQLPAVALAMLEMS